MSLIGIDMTIIDTQNDMPVKIQYCFFSNTTYGLQFTTCMDCINVLTNSTINYIKYL